MPSKGRTEAWLAMSGRERLTFGCIVSFRNAHGESWSWTRPGHVLDVIRDACDAAVHRDPSNLVVCISSPTTIYSDLYGRAFSPRNATVETPERNLLTRAGRRHMLHPDLLGDFSRA